MQLVASNHYHATAHHAFVLETVESVEFDVAVIQDPNQLRLSDDPDNAHLDPASWNMKS